MNVLEELEDILKNRADDWSEQDRTTANSIAADLANLVAKDLQGEDVEQELAIAKASARNIATGAAFSGINAFKELAGRIALRAAGLLATL